MTFSLPGRQASKKQKVTLGQNCSQKQIWKKKVWETMSLC